MWRGRKEWGMSYPFHYPLWWKTRGLVVLVLDDQPINDYIFCAIDYGGNNPHVRIPRDELEETGGAAAKESTNES